jgi:hypothetical protein
LLWGLTFVNECKTNDFLFLCSPSMLSITSV